MRTHAPRGRAVVPAAAFFLIALLVMLLAPQPAHAAPREVPLEPGTFAVVFAEGTCLNLRESPGLDGGLITCLADGSTVEVLDGAVLLDGYRWQQVRRGTVTGWAADEFLAPVPPAPDAPAALPEPPAGGLTFGLAGTTDPAALVAVQPFETDTVSMLDVVSQQFLVYIPGAPSFVNTLAGNLLPGSVVAIRRAGPTPEPGPLPAAEPLPAAGEPYRFPMPPAGGLTQGVAGTNDPAMLVEAQSFEVGSVSMLHVSSQRWLVYIPGAPAFVITLHSGLLAPDSIVTLRRTEDETPPAFNVGPDPGDDMVEGHSGGTTTLETITYYYCEQGSIPASIGDGGGFCGAMANGQIVFPGAAACARHLMGERFRIIGDPTGRIYTCTDTGSAVFEGHRDIWFADSDSGYLWLREVGSPAPVERLPAE